MRLIFKTQCHRFFKIALDKGPPKNWLFSFRILCTLSIIMLTGFLHSQEVILSYDVDISIQSDSRIEVTETIKVRSLSNQIRRGIFRKIPTVRPDKSGRNEPAPIKVLSVMKDGSQEPYHLKKSRTSLTIYIGEESVVLDPGTYTYEINYLAENQVGFFEDYDELYWNVIGHDWTFPIEEYSTTWHLPEGAGYVQGSCYTGYPGSTSSDCVLQSEQGSNIFQSKGEGSLHPGEGFTVAVAWDKGFVTEKTIPSYEISWINLLLFGIGLLVFIFYGYGLWEKVGEDPPEQAVVPDWHPPDGYSPAESSYLFHRSIVNEALTSALVSSAIKGVIRIENKKKKFTFHRLAESDVLEREEKVLVDGLLPTGKKSFELKSSNYSAYTAAKSHFTNALKQKLNLSSYFRQNWGQGMKAVLLMAILSTIVLSVNMYPLMSHFIISFLATFVFVFVLFVVMSVLFRILKWYKWLIIFPVWASMIGLFVGIYSQVIFFTSSFVWIAIIIGLGLFVVGLFNYLIYAPTPKGQEATAKIKGFRMYLDKSEKAMLEYFTPPEQTPELFEKMLPFAIALGVENKWARKFKSILDDAIEKGTYSPVWYSGNIHQINTLHSNFQSTVSHAAPKSSSGSGGGGFSGGGGGGGGGGGW